eukprot:TRINITY_DN38535_c0_g1_i1.p1 TRINITY_DN38535_c0_g1~~TRINITY_DN38535_c0_g1_i1.p1  ORF type:complete len:462 (-),score=35.16 TRINITY_DN38535_c0_g1_i1:499-1884(-)
MECPCSRRVQISDDVNIGGKLFPSAFKAVSSCPTLASVARRGRDGIWFIDRDGHVYEYILPFLIEGRLAKHPVDQSARARLLSEAKFLGLTELITILRSHVGAPLPANEDARLLRLRTFWSSLQAGGSESLDHITRMAATIHDSPTALLSFIDRQVHMCISRVGFEHATRPRSHSFCAHTLILENTGRISPLVVNDTRQDRRFQNNPLVVGEPYVRTYCGSPLVTSDGFHLGALCTMDTKPTWRSSFQIQVLMNLSYIAMLELERDQLFHRTLNSRDSDPAPETTCAALRNVRMQQAAAQLVGLVHIGAHGAMGYRLLYTNSVWSSTVGVNLTPPRTLPADAKAFGQGVPWPANNPPDCGPLLWHWLRLDGETEDDFDVRLREQWKHGSSMSTMIVKGILRIAPGMPRQRMVGRFVEARMPLDVSMAVEEEKYAGETHEACRDSSGSLDGFFAFVLLHPDV